MQEFVCIRIIGYFEVCAVPNELLAAIMDADAAEQHGFSQRPCKIKTGTGRPISFASLKPFLMVANGSGQGLGWPLIFLVARLGQQAWMLSSPPADKHLAFVANKDDPI